jgi:acyl-CoA thioesterase-1
MGGFLIATLCLTACRPAAETPPAPASSEIPPPAADTRPAIVFLGDSLTAGYRLDPAEAYPTLIQEQLDAAGHAYRVINAGVSGDTTLDGLQRLDWVLRQPVAIFVLALGANDALRGQPIDHIRDTLDAILTRVREREPNVRLVLAGMRMPSNYGAAYTRAFADLYATLADQHAATLIPFLLDGVAGQPELNLSDGIHPTAAGHQIIADTVWSHLEPLL